MRRHRFDPWSLVAGIVFAALGMVVLVGDVDVTDWNLSWAGPAVFILAGLLLLWGARGRRQPQQDADRED